MKYAGLATVLAATATLASAALPGCGERIIVVQAPPAPTTNTATTSATAGNNPLPLATGTPTAEPGEWGIRDRTSEEELSATIQKVVAMPNDSDLRARVARRGLSVVNVAWEDTGRSVGSSVGPNISDLSLQVRTRDARGGFGGAVMPVVRFPNFSDRTGDVPADKFFVRVGNEKAGTLASVPLRDVLQNLRGFVSMPSSIQGSGNLLAGRDSHFLVSAQAVFL
ncbi:MAG TPA: hypothetical protein PK141_09675, partial [Polyangiaceae bacterium]|nr:hypothetical protein [Polyangiaceae bacterium]